MKKLNIFYYLMIIVLSVYSQQLLATEFCVSDSVEFQMALTSAQNNGQHDHIKLQKNTTYTVTKGLSFSYSAAAGEFYNLTISGGWSGVNCSFTQRQIYSTTIDGDFQGRGLLIETVDGAHIEITDLNFTNGSVLTGNEGGGLFIDTSNGSVISSTIERNTFLNNYASVGGAFSQNNSNRTYFKNNLVVNNHSEAGAAVNIESYNQNGIYVINNTIMNNTTDQTSSFGSAGVYLWISDSSEAFVANNILWGNQINDLWFLGYTHLYNNDIGSQTAPADVDVGNISVTPDFFAYGVYGNDFIPKHNTALHNSGHHPPTFVHVPPWFEENWNHGDYDVSGRYTRNNEGLVDIGAFETPPDYPIFENGFECEDDDARGGFDCIGS